MALPNKTKIPVGTMLAGKYRITREIGRGGMATVHEAENVDIGKRVAIKVLAQELTGSSIVVERFLREARAAAAIRSPYICDVYDSGKLPSGQPFLVLELLEGESLYERMTRQRQLDAPTTIAVISQVCRGLTKAHAASIVHRDLKPENIFLTKDEEGHLLAKILDFGLAKFYTPTTKDQARLTREGAVFGTPAYMSPEQVRGQGAVDHRADLWALGCITYECFTGKTVWSTDQGVAMTFAQIASAPLPKAARYRPDLPQEFTTWFERTLDRNIERRFQTAKEFAETLATAFGMERRETSEIRPSPVDARNEAAAALYAQPQQPQPPQPAAGQPPAQHAPQLSSEEADAFRPISQADEDGDPTRVLTKRPLVKQLDPHAKIGGDDQRIDPRMERFRRTPDGKIAKIVPQVLPNSPPIPAGMRSPPGPPTPVSQRPVPHSQRPPPASQRPAQQAAQAPPPASKRGTAMAAFVDQDTDFDKNPFAKARKRRRLAIVLTLVVLAVLVVVFAITSSTGPSNDGSGSSDGASGEPIRTGTTGETTSASASTTTAPTAAPASREPPLPEWMTEVRDAQAALASGDTKTATAKLGQAVSKSGQHAAAQGLARQVGAAVFSKGTCSLTGIARPRSYDLANAGSARVTATRPSVATSGSTTLAAWTDTHGGASHAYVARIDTNFALAEGAIDLTPDGMDVRGVDLLAWGDKLLAVYTDAKASSPGTFGRWLGADGKPAGAAVHIGPPRSAQAMPLIAGEPGQALVLGWTGEGDRDSEDLFLQKLSMTTLEPEGAAVRATDLVPSGAPRVRALLPDAAFAKGALRVAFELERKPASFIELQTIALADMGREMSASSSNREGKALGSLALVNIDKSRAHAPRIACSQDLCFVAWHGESPPGAQGAAFENASGRALWRRKFSPNAQFPAVAATASGAAAVWIEDGKIVATPLGRAGFGRTSKVGKGSAAQSTISITTTPEKGQFIAAWLDTEGAVAEPYVARLRCP